LVERHARQGLAIKVENLIITTGSQQAIDLIGRIFIDPGDYVLCGLPSYLGALNTFLVYGAKMKGITLDNEGIVPDMLEETIVSLREYGRKLKLIYIIPDFQNPSGITLPESRRKQVIEIAEKYDLLIIEDSPYREIRFNGEPQKTMYELTTYRTRNHLFTFSKIFARLQGRLGDRKSDYFDKIIMAKQTSDLCTAPFNQK
jgi:2-aminoadipate transaminase